MDSYQKYSMIKSNTDDDTIVVVKTDNDYESYYESYMEDAVIIDRYTNLLYIAKCFDDNHLLTICINYENVVSVFGKLIELGYKICVVE
jgi:hypothetical protein